MNILFIMAHPGYMRYYYMALRALASKGHTIHLAFDNPPKQARDRLAERLAEEFPKVTIRKTGARRKDAWQGLARAIAWTMDYSRYLTPMYANTPRLRLRTEAAMHPLLMRLLRKISSIAGPFGVRLTSWWLKQAYKAIPASRRIKKLIRAAQPDLVLVTPLVTQGSFQGEYLKAAKALRIRTAYCVASWDNLTNKGLVRGAPDHLILWNGVQEREAIKLHGVSPHKIVLTGAQNFDEWFERRASTTKDEFCQRVGLRSDKPIVLYMYSSNFMAPNEVPFVTKWIERVRSSDDASLNGIGILIRPYPEHAAPWSDADLSSYGNVAIWPREGAYPLTDESQAVFFDSIYHSAAIVGVNTSALIEAAIIGRPVLTVLDPEFQGSQEGTIHFHYLLKENGGFVQVGSNLDEHLQQLKKTMEDRSDQREMQLFVERFVRPHGLDAPCVPFFVETIERLGAMGPPKSLPNPVSISIALWRLILRLGLLVVRPHANKLWESQEWERQRVDWKKAAREAEKLGADPLLLFGQESSQDGEEGEEDLEPVQVGVAKEADNSSVEERA